VAGCCECGDEPSGSCATELVSQVPVAWPPISLDLTSSDYNLLGRIWCME
jgi:hypothetical protein